MGYKIGNSVRLRDGSDLRELLSPFDDATGVRLQRAVGWRADRHALPGADQALYGRHGGIGVFAGPSPCGRTVLMAARSREKGEDLPNKLELLRVLGEARIAAIAAQSSECPMGTTYHALSMVPRRSTPWHCSSPETQFFHDEAHRTP